MSAVVTEFPRTAGLHAGLLERMRKLINEGDLLPGARVPERALCERFGVSRTPLRECLKVLAAEGAVELLPNRGARVARLEGEDLIHLFEVIGALEAEGGRLACARIGAPELAEIQSLHYRMYAHFLRQELPEYFALNQAIHDAIIRASGNPVLVSTHAALAARITRARYMSNRLSPGRWQTAMDEHAAMLDLLLARDGDRLGPLLAQHLQNKRDIIAEALQGAE